MIRSPFQNQPRGLAALRRLAVRPSPQERCDLCAAVLSGEHEHMVDPQNRRLLCACNACALLFDHSGATRYRRIPRDVCKLPDFQIGDTLWNSLAIPIGLVFFFRSSVTNSAKAEGFGSAIVAVYPSPAGPTETIIDEELWNTLAALHGAVAGILTDVEALLVNRTRGARDYYIVPIDQCYRLTGLIRRHWTGISGGDEVWDQIRLFFDRLREQARSAWSASHA